MKHLCCIAILLLLTCVLHAENDFSGKCSAGGVLSYGEISVLYERYSAPATGLAMKANIDLSGVISGQYQLPGFSFDLTYLFVFASKTFDNGESISGYAGPGFKVGYLHSSDGRLGPSAGLCGVLGMEYRFVYAPVSLCLSLEPAIISTFVRPSATEAPKMEFYKSGLINGAYPRVTIKYNF